jgi:hypothetical protein
LDNNEKNVYMVLAEMEENQAKMLQKSYLHSFSCRKSLKYDNYSALAWRYNYITPLL